MSEQEKAIPIVSQEESKNLQIDRDLDYLLRENCQLEQEMVQLKSRISRSYMKKRELKHENKCLRKESVCLFDEIEEYKKRTEAKAKKNERLFKEKQGLYNKNEALKAEMEAYKKYREEMEQVKMNFKRIKNRKKQELKSENVNLFHERFGLHDIMEDFKKRTQAKEKECEHLMKEKLGLYYENEALKTEVQAHKTYREKMSMLHNERSDKLMIMSKDREMDNMQQDTESLISKVQEVTNSLKDAQHTTVNLQHANINLQLISDLLRHNCKLEQEIEQLEMNIKYSKNKEKRELQYENEFLHEDRVRLNYIIEELKKLTQVKEKEGEHLSKEKLDLYIESETIKAEMKAHKKYRKEMEKLKKKLKLSGNKEKREFQNDNGFLHKERVALYDRAENLKKLAQAKERECEHLINEKLAQYNENEALKAEIQAYTKYREEVSMLHNRRSKELLIMSKDSAMDDMQQGTEGLINKVQELTNSLRDVQRTTVDLQHANSHLHQDNEKLQTDLRRLENETESMREEIKTHKILVLPNKDTKQIYEDAQQNTAPTHVLELPPVETENHEEPVLSDKRTLN